MIRREILVHAGAPSSRKDDDKYRAQAAAYLAFRGDIVRGSQFGGSVVHHNSAPEHHHQIHNIQKASCHKAKGPSRRSEVFLEDTQLAYAALDSELLTSSLLDDGIGENNNLQLGDVPSSSLPRNVAVTDRASVWLKDSSPVRNEMGGYRHSLKVGIDEGVPCNRPSEERSTSSGHAGVSQSSYLKTPKLDRPSKRVKVADDTFQEAPAQIRDAGSYIPLLEDGKFGVAYVGQHVVPAVPGQLDLTHSQHPLDAGQTTSELPTSYSLSDITSRGSKARPSASQRSASDPGPQIGSISPTALRAVPTPCRKVLSLHRAASDTHVAVPGGAPASAGTDLRPKGASNHTGHGSTEARTDLNVERPHQASDKPAHRTTEEHLRLLGTLSITIRPPQPPVALDKYTTHITRGLQQLGEHPDLKDCFKPVTASRELRPLERGHWLIWCPTDDPKWSLEKQVSFWQWIEKYVGNGTAGWGIWCTRQNAEDESVSLGPIEVWCWGEVVKHIYHMLYVASSAQVRKLGLQWIDAEGKVVVQMKSG